MLMVINLFTVLLRIRRCTFVNPLSQVTVYVFALTPLIFPSYSFGDIPPIYECEGTTPTATAICQPPIIPAYLYWVGSVGFGIPVNKWFPAEQEAIDAIISALTTNTGFCSATPTPLAWGTGEGGPQFIFGNEYRNEKYIDVTIVSHLDNPVPCDSTTNNLVNILRLRNIACSFGFVPINETIAAGYCALRNDIPMNYIEDELLDKPCGEGNPCDPATGSKYQQESDVDIPGIRFSRYYHSKSTQSSLNSLGVHWRHSFSSKLDDDSKTQAFIDNSNVKSNRYSTKASACQGGWGEIKDRAFHGLMLDTTAVYQNELCDIQRNGTTVATLVVRSTGQIPQPLPGQTSHTLTRPDGTILTFEQQAGQWVTTSKTPVKLEQIGTNWHFTDLDDTVEVYDTTGNLVSSTTRNGLLTALSYNPDETLHQVTGPFGHALTFAYDANSRIDTVTSPQGSFTYRYDTNNNLEYVDNPDGTTKQYHYEDATHPHHLTGITDERGIRYATWAYDAEGRAILSEHAGGTEQVTFTYNPDSTTTVTTGEGAIRTYNFEVNHGVMDVTGITGDLCPTCPNGDKKARSYDTTGYLTEFTDWSDSLTRYGNYDAQEQIGCQVEGVNITDTSTGICAFDAATSPEARRTDYSYDSRFNNKTTTITAPSVFYP